MYVAEPGGAVADAGPAAAGGAARAAASVAHLHQGAGLVGLRGNTIPLHHTLELCLSHRLHVYFTMS